MVRFSVLAVASMVLKLASAGTCHIFADHVPASEQSGDEYQAVILKLGPVIEDKKITGKTEGFESLYPGPQTLKSDALDGDVLFFAERDGPEGLIKSCSVEFGEETFDGEVADEGESCTMDFECTDEPDPEVPKPPIPTKAKKAKKAQHDEY